MHTFIKLTSFALILTTGCANHAVLVRRDGARLQGEILSSTEETLAVRVNGRLHDIPRTDIADVDHPGDGMIVGGTLLLIPGLALTATGIGLIIADRGCEDLCLGGPMGGIMMAAALPLEIVGSILVARGARRLRRSRQAATPALELRPTVHVDVHHGTYGGGLQLRF